MPVHRFSRKNILFQVYYLPFLVVYNGTTLPTIIGSLPWLRKIFIRERIQVIHGHSVDSRTNFNSGLFGKLKITKLWGNVLYSNEQNTKQFNFSLYLLKSRYPKVLPSREIKMLSCRRSLRWRTRPSSTVVWWVCAPCSRTTLYSDSRMFRPFWWTLSCSSIPWPSLIGSFACPTQGLSFERSIASPM